ncbi:MAG: glycerophosphodiester phosphodiesterase family protein [Acidimicrobiia bacterium]
MFWVTEMPIAHRGLHDAARPENSLAAFGAALEAGYPIELDVQLLRDGAVAVFHDESLERMAGLPGHIRHQTRASLAGMRLAASEETIPLLEDVLDRVGEAVPLLVELKSPDPVGRLEEETRRRLEGYRGAVAVCSFNPRSVAWFRDRAPDVLRGQDGSDEPDAPYGPGLDLSADPHFVAYDLRSLPQEAVDRARGRGMPLVAWTVRTSEDLRRAGRLADNFIFEGIFPLGGSGGWSGGEPASEGSGPP